MSMQSGGMPLIVCSIADVSTNRHGSHAATEFREKVRYREVPRSS